MWSRGCTKRKLGGAAMGGSDDTWINGGCSSCKWLPAPKTCEKASFGRTTWSPISTHAPDKYWICSSDRVFAFWSGAGRVLGMRGEKTRLADSEKSMHGLGSTVCMKVAYDIVFVFIIRFWYLLKHVSLSSLLKYINYSIAKTNLNSIFLHELEDSIIKIR